VSTFQTLHLARAEPGIWPVVSLKGRLRIYFEKEDFRREKSYEEKQVVWGGSAVFPALSQAGPATKAAVRNARQRMEAAAGAPVKMTVSPQTDLATFLAASPGKLVPTAAPPAANPEVRARQFLRSYGPAFGITDAAQQVRVQRLRELDEVGMDHVRFQQLHRGVPVTGGELTVHLRGAQVTAVNAKTLPDLEKVETVPTVSPKDAQVAAYQVLAKHLKVTDATLSKPRLEVFNQGLLEDRHAPTRLAWFIEATKIDVREFIWVDAQRGGVLLHFSQLTDAKTRSIHDTNSTNVLPGTLVRSEGGAATADLDVNAAYDFSGDTYDYFFTQHGRDSYDGAGALLRSTVDYCPAPAECPYQNAFWNGVQMVYGAGFSRADDVDAHELTHAVTEFSANLFYYMQSGALNESFSDIFGETVDLLNGAGNDAAGERWRLAEDLPGIGASRNMMTPTLFGDPGKVSDAQFVCATPGNDSGGVHSNSGVPNHAYALMVDGGTYNLQMVTGIGLTKAGKIQYRALTVYLLSGSGFLDNYNAVQQACSDLIGTAGITAGNCAEVKKALDAVEMATTTMCARPAPPAFCPAGQGPVNVFFDNLENPASGQWVTSTIAGVNHWLDDSLHTAFGGCTGTPDIYCSVAASSGQYAFWGYDRPTIADSAVAMTGNVAIPAGGARMQFNHSYGFEEESGVYYDGGVIEYSTNNGGTWTDAGALITGGAVYGGILESDFSNPLGGRPAFVRESFGYTASQLNLNSLAGQNARFRFRIGTDESGDDYGWFIDDVRVYTCACAYTLSPLNATMSASGGSSQTVTVTNGSGCGWTAVSTTSWITVTAGSAGTGNGTVTYSVAANPGPNPRRGTMTIAGKTFIVSQATPVPTPCTITIPSGTTRNGSMGTGNFAVTASTASCAWSARSHVPWITITSGASGTGSGTVQYSVTANPGPGSRAGRITVNGKRYTVTQTFP
jgi:bacillolysin